MTSQLGTQAKQPVSFKPAHFAGNQRKQYRIVAVHNPHQLKAPRALATREQPIIERPQLVQQGINQKNQSKYDSISTSNVNDRGPVILNGEKLYRVHDYGREVVDSLEGFVGDQVLPLLDDPNKCWQPQDLLPDPSSESFIDQIKDLRERSREIPAEFFVVLAGDMITEEALPTYMSQLNTFEGCNDVTGSLGTPWAIWNRRWTSEENRHGDVMNKYMYLTGRVDLKNIEMTIQRLISRGMNPGIDTNPYLGFIYTSFQEKATVVSHSNTAKLANKFGDKNMAKICGVISKDEGRHEAAYTKIMREIFKLDPNNAMKAFAHMMRRQIVMPAHFMDDGSHDEVNGRNLFQDYANVAEKLGVYTAIDYANILDHLIKKWDIPNMTGLSPEG